MLYAILCYDNEDAVFAWPKDHEEAVMSRLMAVQDKLHAEGRMGPVARLLPTTSATTLRKGKDQVILDGPFAETKEQLLGFYVIDCDDLDHALSVAKDLAAASGSAGAFEVRPLLVFHDWKAQAAETAPA
ncbi:MAG: YciI family protein [Caulobacteraceae bacterium]